MANIHELVSKYRYDKKLRKYSDRHEADSFFFSSINDKKDIQLAEANVRGRLNTYSKIYPLVNDDIEDLGKAMARYETAVRKAIQCYDLSDGRFAYSTEELQGLINSVFEYQEKVEQVMWRKAVQD
ncbi:hypothetical protein [Paenibacillus sp. USDA918EY]|uniref:hypothetical protein n=1 Tax=Paenibacillus sp. USDA918EY TaxID=2689575 RepID=UPI00135711D2|nr:hypothetical protein [Paenibacillus sp. USDA918EY]